MVSIKCLAIFLSLVAVAVADYTAEFDDLVTNEAFNVKSRWKRQDPFGFLNEKPVIRSLTITSNIVARFSTTEVKSEVENLALDSQAVHFQTQLPKTAFISNFSIIIDDVEYVGVIKSKEEAQRNFQAAQSQGRSAGLVESSQRETRWFKISVNVESFNIVTFKLQYQQLLTRRFGQYEQIVFADPEQNVDSVNVDVYLTEPTGIKILEGLDPFKGTTDLSPQDDNFLKDVSKSNVQGRVSYWTFNFEVPEGTSGGRRFVVQYEVEHQDQAGDVFQHNGYFVHFFAPTLPVLPKQFVLALDVSGTMSGTKLEQAKTATISLIDQLKNADYFGIVPFSNRHMPWRPTLTIASDVAAKEAAKTFVRGLTAGGSTNMFAGVVSSLQMLHKHDSSHDDVIEGTSAVILLTDGKPERGLTDLNLFRKYLRTVYNPDKYPIFSLGFGAGANHDFLEILSTENRAVSRKIFESFDADKQISDFFKEIANPVLAKISMTYVGNVNNLTQTTFEVFNQGSEITVIGKTDVSMDSPVEVNVVAFGFGDDFSVNGFGNNLNSAFDYPVAENIDVQFNVFFERMWAYLSIQQLTKRELIETNPAVKKTLQDEVIATALKYNFVTPFTSIIAEKPDNGEEFLNLLEGRPANEEEQFEIQEFKVEEAFEDKLEVGEELFPPPPPEAKPFIPQQKRENFNFGKGVFVFAHKVFPTRTTTRATTTTTTTTVSTTTAKPTRRTTAELPPPPSNPDDVIGDPDCDVSANVVAVKETIVQSPGDLYRRNMTCKWTITDFMNRKMRMHFERFDLEDTDSCNRDRLLIYIDDEFSSKTPIILCGDDVPSNRVYWSAGRIILIMQTNYVVQGRGFKVVFK